jgi:hypothetical protein
VRIVRSLNSEVILRLVSLRSQLTRRAVMQLWKRQAGEAAIAGF